MIVGGSLEVKLPTIWTDEKQRWRESQRREEKKKEKVSEERRSMIQAREKVEKSRFLAFFPMICAPEGRKVGSLKRRVRSQLARPLWRDAISKSKCTKHLSSGELLEVALPSARRCGAKQIFRSQNVQNTSCSEHFWKLRCRKSARRCGAKHIWK